MFIEILIFVITFAAAYVFYTHWSLQNNFERHGVRFLKGWPLFGNVVKSTFLKRHFWDDLDEVYRAFPDDKYVGYMEATVPIIMIRDPEVIKTITVKDFDHFVNHRDFFPEEIEPLFGGSVLLMKDDRWRDMRTTLSPAFTGSKMRAMMPFMAEISNNIVQYIQENLQDQDVHVDDIVRRYTNDVIASAGFGLQVNSLQDKDNEFYKLGQTLFKFTVMQRMVMFAVAICPSLITKLKIKIFPEKVSRFFKDTVANTIAFREQNNVERPDMIQLLMEASQGKLKHTSTEENDDVGFATVQEALKPKGNARNWTLNELTGQVFIFFVAGFESTATALVMCLHELAINPDIQEKLYQEVRTFEQNRGKLTYDNVNELKYLDCVLNETMRKWSAALIMDRVCSKTYDLPPPREGGKAYRLKPGDVVYNMVNCLHMDPQYFPNPHKFDPERFTDENKHNIKPFTFMPFGMGPRNCIGSRFALLELKILLNDLILNFKIQKCEKTIDPIKLDPSDFNIRVTGGTWAKFVSRKRGI